MYKNQKVLTRSLPPHSLIISNLNSEDLSFSLHFHLLFKMASTKDVEMTEKKTAEPNDPHARIERSNSRSEEARSKRSNKGGGFGTDR